MKNKSKTCYIHKYTVTKNRYMWDTKVHQDNCDVCILACHFGRSVFTSDLVKLKTNNFITDEEFNSIQAFDSENGSYKDLTIIRKLGKRLGVELKVDD